MSGFNADDYVDVAERITQFYEKYPDGRLTTIDWDVKPDLDGKAFLWVHAKAYRTVDDPLPGDGLAWYPVPGAGFLEGSELMKAQTAAIGRAIVMLGFQTKNVASRDEVEAARNGDPHGLKESRGDAVQHDQEIFTFGKHKGSKIEDVPRSYLEWWLTSDSSKSERNQGLRAAVELHLGLAAVGAPDDLDIPF